MRYLVLSDIHGNLKALEAVLEDAPSGLPIWCLGDIVGYGPNPNECIELLQRYEHACIVGNHDWAVMGKVDVEDFNPDAKHSVQWTQDQLSENSLNYLEQLGLRQEHGEFTLVHGSPRDPIWEYLFRPGSACISFGDLDTLHALVGHTHVPCKFTLYQQNGLAHCEMGRLIEGAPQPLGADRMILNPGSVGQPRDGDVRASYALIDVEAQTYEHRRVYYDVKTTQEWMTKAKLPERNITRLSYGW
jgi:diadenosine tetraphosphatase ApaH/serine/threonine PP2A family protein phosphatase